ncbi:MAG TPA: RNA-binding domain-containing protein [Patescibacteria group bacterium]|nr:RNA-binding domain-containing protein [Patescibacteria group bacterium]
MASGKSVGVTWVQLSVLAHATDDLDKVEGAMLNVVDEVEVRLRRRDLKGYYKDPITLVSAEIKRKKAARGVFEHVIRSLSSLDVNTLLDEIDERTDESGNLYLRLDKQKALRGVLTLNRSDPIRMKFRFRVPHGENPAEVIRDVIEACYDEDAGS